MSSVEQLINELANLQGKSEEIVQAADAVKTEQVDLIAKQGQLIAAVTAVAGKLKESQMANEQIEKLMEQARAGKTNQTGKINQILSILKGAPSSQDVSNALERVGQAISELEPRSGSPAGPFAGGYKRHSTRGEKLISAPSSSRKKRKSKASRSTKGGRKTVSKTKKHRGCGC